MGRDDIVVYGSVWCGDCRRARRFFDRHNIPYVWIDVDKDREGEEIVRRANGGMRSVPTIFFPDGTILVEPSNSQLSEKMGICSH